MNLGFSLSIPSFGWINKDKQAAQVARSSIGSVMYGAESGTSCPQTMTFACVPVLEKHATDRQRAHGWLSKAQASEYDPRNVPIGEKSAITLGMSMTEAQGGSVGLPTSSFPSAFPLLNPNLGRSSQYDLC
eukprot:m.100585 g.100585  ORF g.100585 m.100585 type:complete len:131 (+) comp15131_c0_seq8:214-606(+)